MSNRCNGVCVDCGARLADRSSRAASVRRNYNYGDSAFYRRREHCDLTHRYDATNRGVEEDATDKSWLLYPAGASSVSYTANGSFNYCYDAESRLTAVISAGTCAAPTTTVASYAYDGQGRRKSKTVGGTTTLYVTDADNREVLEYDGAAGAIQRWYAYGIGPDSVLNQMNAPGTPTRATLIPDIQRSVPARPHRVAGLSPAPTLSRNAGEGLSGGPRRRVRRAAPELRRAGRRRRHDARRQRSGPRSPRTGGIWPNLRRPHP